MDISNEMLFYGGMIASAASFLCIVAGLVIFKFKKMTLDHRFDEEYGKEKKDKG